MKIHLIFLSITLFSFSQEWTLEKDKDGILVYAKKVEGYSFSETKTITTLDISKDAFIDFIWNIAAYPNWQDEYKESRIIKKNSESDIDVYFEFNAPWPVQGRDVVINMKKETKNGLSYIYIKTTESNIDVKDDIVRMPSYNGFWKIKEVGDKLEITFQILAIPGGKIPSFMVEFYKATGPFNYFVNMKKELNK